MAAPGQPALRADPRRRGDDPRQGRVRVPPPLRAGDRTQRRGPPPPGGGLLRRQRPRSSCGRGTRCTTTSRRTVRTARLEDHGVRHAAAGHGLSGGVLPAHLELTLRGIREGYDHEVGHPGVVSVRDSRVPGGAKLVFRTASWSVFVDALK
ncbi:DUF397 domain-containing protein [Streptomyces sp. NPDC126499]|uniref:DUF397 domain-containing protein n=1 Tax=Streptomyces sp. NPDC126499 TaxID=3155314 RepID=UPI00387E3BD9